MYPSIGLPRMTIGRVPARISAAALPSLPTRTSRPRADEAPTAMLPLTMKQMPPNMDCSVMRASPASIARIRSASGFGGKVWPYAFRAAIAIMM
jgi:hypothetical protein